MGDQLATLIDRLKLAKTSEFNNTLTFAWVNIHGKFRCMPKFRIRNFSPNESIIIIKFLY